MQPKSALQQSTELNQPQLRAGAERQSSAVAAPCLTQVLLKRAHYYD